MKGWIALDIDGTITQDKYSVPEPVIVFLKEAYLSGWSLALATGRAAVFALPALEKFDFPFVLLTQNGSLALEMPSRQIFFKRYLSSGAIHDMEKAYEGMETDFLVYGGYEEKDRCYFRPSKLSKEDLVYVRTLQEREKEPWITVDRFDLGSDFPLIKCFGRYDVMKKLEGRLLQSPLFQISFIRDPFCEAYYLLLVTKKKVSKGESLKELFRCKGRGSLVIGAGDDENDISLLKASDVRIAMPHAPESLRKIADFIAPSVKENGIIQALNIVIKNAENRRT